MVGFCMFIVVFYGEGYVEFVNSDVVKVVFELGIVVVKFVDNYGNLIM